MKYRPPAPLLRALAAAIDGIVVFGTRLASEIVFLLSRARSTYYWQVALLCDSTCILCVIIIMIRSAHEAESYHQRFHSLHFGQSVIPDVVTQKTLEFSPDV